MYISSYFTMEIIPKENIKNLKYIISKKHKSISGVGIVSV